MFSFFPCLTSLELTEIDQCRRHRHCAHIGVPLGHRTHQREAYGLRRGHSVVPSRHPLLASGRECGGAAWMLPTVLRTADQGTQPEGEDAQGFVGRELGRAQLPLPQRGVPFQISPTVGRRGGCVGKEWKQFGGAV